MSRSITRRTSTPRTIATAITVLSFLLGLLPLLETLAADEPAIAGLAGVFATKGFVSALAAMSFSEWATFAIDVATAAPVVKKALIALHPALADLVADLDKGIDRHDAAANARAWFSANQPATIPGYQPDGSVGPIPNPDKPKET